MSSEDDRSEWQDIVTPTELIERVGTDIVARYFGVSIRTARRWRESPPDERLQGLVELAEEHGLAITTSTHSFSLTAKMNEEGRDAPLRFPTVIEQEPIPEATPVDVQIAERDVAFARSHVAACSAEAGGLPPIPPVSGYGWRLFGLSLLDLPVLATAFAAVAEVSPIIALFSGLALSVFLVLGAHAIGWPLQQITGKLPPWIPGSFGLLVMAGFLAATIFGVLDLRAKGLDVDEITSAAVSVFTDDQSKALPASFKQAIIFTAGLVTIGSLLFAISWSYAHHSPQADFARAEVAYRKSLRHLENAKGLARRVSIATGLLASLGFSFHPNAAVAASCPGKDVLVLIDATTAYDEVDLAAIKPAIDAMGLSLEPGDRLRVRTVRDHPEKSVLLFQGCMPEQNWLVQLITNPQQAKARRAAFFQEVRTAIEPILHLHHDAQSTALAATLAAFAPADAIWLFSDLLETQTTSVDELLKEQLTGPPLPAMPGVIVNVAGIGRFHDTQRRELTRQEFGGLIDAWSRYLETAGVSLRLLDIER